MIDFSTRVETEESIFGPWVVVVKTRVEKKPDGVKITIVKEQPMRAAEAVFELTRIAHEAYWNKARIKWGPVFDEWSY